MQTPSWVWHTKFRKEEGKKKKKGQGFEIPCQHFLDIPLQVEGSLHYFVCFCGDNSVEQDHSEG